MGSATRAEPVNRAVVSRAARNGRSLVVVRRSVASGRSDFPLPSCNVRPVVGILVQAGRGACSGTRWWPRPGRPLVGNVRRWVRLMACWVVGLSVVGGAWDAVAGGRVGPPSGPDAQAVAGWNRMGDPMDPVPGRGELRRLLIDQMTGRGGGPDADEGALLAFVGDILLHTPLQRQSIREADGFVSLWRDVLPYLSAADLAYGNLEGVIAPKMTVSGVTVSTDGLPGDEYIYTGYPRFNYPPDVAAALARSGFNVLSTANNHGMDRGPGGVDLTIEHLEAHGLHAIGTRHSRHSDAPGFTLTRAGPYTVGWIACTYGLNGLPDPAGQVELCFAHEDAILARIRDLLEGGRADAVIVTPHWGAEYSTDVTVRQRAFAHRAIAAGASLVVGNHPHVLQPWEQHLREDGSSGLVAYSLGNFVSNQKSLATRTTALLLVRLGRDEAGRIGPLAAGYVPLVVTLPSLRPDAPRIGVAPLAAADPEAAAVDDLLARTLGRAGRLDPPYRGAADAVADAGPHVPRAQKVAASDDVASPPQAPSAADGDEAVVPDDPPLGGDSEGAPGAESSARPPADPGAADAALDVPGELAPSDVEAGHGLTTSAVPARIRGLVENLSYQGFLGDAAPPHVVQPGTCRTDANYQRLKGIVADLSLENQILRDIIRELLNPTAE